MSELRQAWVNYFSSIINDYEWDWYLTLTFRNPIGLWKLRTAWNYFMRYLRKKNKSRVEWFKIIEWQRKRIPPVPHIHCLMLNINLISIDMAKRYWDTLFGFSKIVKYNQEYAGRLSEYISKDFINDFVRVNDCRSEIEYFDMSDKLKRFSLSDIKTKYPLLAGILGL